MDRLKDMLKSKPPVPEDEEFEERLEEDEEEYLDREYDESLEDAELGDQEEDAVFASELGQLPGGQKGVPDKQKGITIEAESVEEGLEIAARKLKSSITDLEYEILRNGSKGFLGLGAKPFLFRIFSNKIAEVPVASGAAGSMEFKPDFKHIIAEPENVDGSFRVRVTRSGVLLKVISPKGRGRHVGIEEIQQKLVTKGVPNLPVPKIKEVLAKADGTYTKIAEWQGNAANDASLSIEIAQDEMQAFVRMIPPRAGGRTLEEEQVIQSLSQRGIVEGVKKEEITRMLDEEIYHNPVEVAKGALPVNGEDAKIEFKFRTSNDALVLTEDEKTHKMDFHNLNLVENVVVGQVLAVRIPASKPQPGRTVTGKKLEAKPGKDLPIPIGKNCKLEENGNKAVSEINGQVQLVKGLIVVDPIYEVQGDVGLSTGNIVFLGSVLVRGNVDDGFTIKAAGNIDIRGSVGKSKLEAEGDVYLRQGCAGKDDAEVIAGHDIYAKFVEHAKMLKAENDIIITEGLMHSKVMAGKRVVCNGKRAQIVGGEVLAGEEVNAKTIGSPSYTETVIEVGIDPKSREEMVLLTTERADLREKSKEVSLNVNTLMEQKKAMRGKLAPEKEELLLTLSTQRDEMSRRLTEVEERINQIKSYLDALEEKGKVAVQKTCYPKVKIMVRNAGLEVKDEFSYVTFVQEGGNIKVLPYEEAIVTGPGAARPGRRR